VRPIRLKVGHNLINAAQSGGPNRIAAFAGSKAVMPPTIDW
jgi:hypothetical protein